MQWQLEDAMAIGRCIVEQHGMRQLMTAVQCGTVWHAQACSFIYIRAVAHSAL